MRNQKGQIDPSKFEGRDLKDLLDELQEIESPCETRFLAVATKWSLILCLLALALLLGVRLLGSSLNEQFNVSVAGAVGEVDPSGTVISNDFESLGSSSHLRALQMRNQGQADLVLSERFPSNVTFTTSGLHSHSGMVSIHGNDPDHSSYTFEVHGRAQGTFVEPKNLTIELRNSGNGIEIPDGFPVHVEPTNNTRPDPNKLARKFLHADEALSDKNLSSKLRAVVRNTESGTKGRGGDSRQKSSSGRTADLVIYGAAALAVPFLLATFWAYWPTGKREGEPKVQFERRPSIATGADTLTIPWKNGKQTESWNRNPPTANADFPETTVPGIQLIESVGSGAQGVVWYGKITDSQEPVAVKLLHSSNREATRAVMREITLCSRVHHPNILNIIFSDWVGPYFVLVMDWIDGRPLRPELYPSTRDKIRCIRKLALAIEALAKAEIVHRDIKPANIVVQSGSNNPVLVDFGVAFDRRTKNLGTTNVSGTPFYMPPEGFSNEYVPSAAFDLYSLGVLVLYLFNHLPAKKRSAIDSLIAKKKSGEFQEILEPMIDQLPSVALKSFTRTLLDENAAFRLQVFEQLEERLEAIATESPPQAVDV